MNSIQPSFGIAYPEAPGSPVLIWTDSLNSLDALVVSHNSEPPAPQPVPETLDAQRLQARLANQASTSERTPAAGRGDNEPWPLRWGARRQRSPLANPPRIVSDDAESVLEHSPLSPTPQAKPGPTHQYRHKSGQKPGRHLSWEFKARVLQRVKETGCQVAVAREFNINDRTLRRWLELARTKDKSAFPLRKIRRTQPAPKAPETTARSLSRTRRATG